MRWSRALFVVSLIMLMVVSSFTVVVSNSTSSNYRLVQETSGVQNESAPLFHLLGSDYNVTIISTRTVAVSPYGVLRLNDTIKFESKDGREFNAFLLFYKLSDLAKLYDIGLIGISAEGNRVPLRWFPYMQIRDYLGLVVILGQYVKKNSSYTVSVFANIRMVPDFTVEKEALVLSIKFPDKILLPYLVSDHVTYFKLLDKQAQLITDKITPANGTKEGNTIYKYAYSNIVPFNMETPTEETIVNLYWRTATPIMYVSEVRRDLTFTVTGALHIEDTMYFTVISPKSDKPPEDTLWGIASVLVGLPTGISGLVAKDNYGKLTITKTSSELFSQDYDAYRVSLRVSLVHGGPYAITLEYNLESDNRWFNSDDTLWNVTIPMLPLINTTVIAANFRISYPAEYRLVNISGIEISNTTEYASVGPFGLVTYSTRVFTLTMVEPNENHLINIIIETNYLPIFDIWLRVFSIVFFIMALLNLAIAKYIKGKEEKVELTVEEKKEIADKLNKYLLLYEEYIAADRDLDEFIKSRLTVRKSPKVTRDTLARLLEITKKYRDKLKIMSKDLYPDKDAFKIAKELNSLEDKIHFTRRELIMDWSNFLGGKLSKKELLVRAESQFNDIKRYKQSRNRLLNRLRNIYIARYAKKK